MNKIFNTLIIINFFYSTANAAQCPELVTNEYFISVARTNSFELEADLLLINTNVNLGLDTNGCDCSAYTDSINIPTTSALYVGDFIVNLHSTCQQAADVILNQWKSSVNLTVYPTGIIEPFPSITLIN